MTSREFNSNKSSNRPIIEEPPIVEQSPKSFGRELFTTEGHETIRELNAAEETPTEDQSEFDLPKVDDPFDVPQAQLPKSIFDEEFANIEKSYLSKIDVPRKPIKNVTGVNFYKRDIKSNHMS